jgi:hypothetical protein
VGRWVGGLMAFDWCLDPSIVCVHTAQGNE